jgi:glycosyltransferase involved in cell wall biosynthesis
MNFNIVLITYNREKFLRRCLNSIYANQGNHKFEIIIIFNGELSYYNSIQRDFPEVKCYYLSTCSPSYARNYAITKCLSESIFFLDDDCFLPNDYFNKISFTENWDVLGGPDATPLDASRFEKNLGYALSSPFCMGSTFKRHTRKTKSFYLSGNESNLILCNLWIKRKIFIDDKLEFPNDLFRNEENFLIKEIQLKSKTILYNPALFVYHSRKNTWTTLSKSVALSAECRVKNFFKLPTKKELIYFSPLIFIIAFLFWVFNPLSFFLYIFTLYFLSVMTYMIFIQRKINPVIVLFHFAIILFYSMGLIKGLLNYAENIWHQFTQKYIT